MTAENPEGVLEDDGDDDVPPSGSLSLLVAFTLTCMIVLGAIIGAPFSVELHALTGAIWIASGLVRFAEVRSE